jgi:hypothetical protein
MSDGPSSASPKPVDRGVWTRIGRLARGAFGAVRDMYAGVVLGALTGAVFGSVIAFVLAPSTLGLAVALVAAVTPVMVGAAPLVRRDRRQAFELVLDLRRSGNRLWQAMDGVAAPQSRAEARRWIDGRASGTIPISVMLVTGRLEAADEAIAGLGEVPPEAAFDVELLRQTRRLYAGEPADLSVVRRAWRDVPAEQRDVARGELACLEAEVAVANGEDPVPILAVARSDLADVHWSVRAPVFVGIWVLVAAATTVVAWLVRPALPFWRP